MSGKTENSESIWNKNFFLLLAANICVSTGFHMISTTMAMYSLEVGATEAVAGTIVGIFSIASLCIRPFCGTLIDTQNKKKIYEASLILLILVMGSYGYAENLKILGFLRFLHGFGFGFATTTGLAMAGDYAPKGKVGSALGMYGIASSVATALAPNLGLAVAERWNFRSMFLMAAGITVLASLFVIPTDSLPARRRYSEIRLTLDQIFSKKVLVIAVMLMILGMANSTVSSFLAVYCKSIQIKNYATYFTVSAVTMILIRPMAGQWMDRWGIEKVFWPAGASLAAGFIVLAHLRSLPLLWIAAVLIGFGYGALQPSLQAAAFTRETEDRRGVTSSTVSVGVDIGNGLGASVAGTLAGAVGYRQMYLLSGTYVVLLAALFVMDIRAQRRHQTETCL